VARLDPTRSDAVRRRTALAASAVALLQLLVEPIRWQTVPAWVLAAALVGLELRAGSPERRSRRRVVGWLVWLTVAAGLPMALPVPSLPDPTGSYAVGTTTIVVTDDSRIEEYGPEPGSPRALPLHVWYPAEPVDADSPGWLDDDVGAIVAESYGLPGFFLDHLSLTSTSAIPDAPFASGDERFPVVLYSHGWGGFGRISPDQPEMLASHGYVVVAPDHTYGALAAEFPDGIVRIDEDALPEEEDVGEAVFDIAAADLVATYAADLRFVLDVLGDTFGLGMGDRIDLERVGIFGHSTGGGAAVEACFTDERCDAVLGFDPWVEPVDPYAISSGLRQPFLAVRSDPWLGEDNDEVLFELHESGSAPSTIVALRGANHYDFVALSQISPLTRFLGFTGSIPAPIARVAIGDSLVAFFDAHLKGVDFELLPLREIRVDAQRAPGR
jgi:predicted dienelactone hydrolase